MRQSVSMSRAGVRGFTLIELMVVVIIISILAAIAYPSYAAYVRRAKRAQAKADMMENAALAERFHTVNNTYIGFDATMPTQSPKDGTKVYGLNFAGTQSTFSITATPVSPQTKDSCGTLTLNQAGVKGQSGGTTSDCW